MRFTAFSHDQVTHLGLLADDQVIDLNLADPGSPQNMRSLLESGSGPLERAAAALQRWAQGRLSPEVSHPLADVRFVAPLPDPPKIVAVGANYLDHCREVGMEPPGFPVLFAKFPTSVIGPGRAIEWDPTLTAKVDYEAELAVIIGQRARNVPAARAFDIIFGFTCANDVTARDLQVGDGQWVRSKSLDTFCPLGPMIVTKDELPEPGRLGIACRVNGETLQDSNTAEMIFDIPTLIEFITRAFTLLPGDVILTGTPHGTGGFRQPNVFLKDGDVVEVEVERVGVLRNPCREISHVEGRL
jgi:2-keto-4-pentenoate hydratase/2-oxohepta-3-ene-1,7-dioic acid hydratase in catechol pathway